ncbi:MAG: hypothetical protein FVQ79_01990 [Planctomycetes bacterium]|nr:hypothetical protein [Planctomycetota bacterium]
MGKKYAVKLPGEKTGVVRRMYVLVGFVAVVILASMCTVLFVGRHMTAVNTPQIDAMMEIKLEAAMGHLWLEEVLSGDDVKSIDDVLGHIDNADWYAGAMLAGGENVEGKFIPLKKAELREHIQQVRDKIAEFRAITLKRWEMKDTSGIGSDIDQKYDAVFEDFMVQADNIETELQRLINRRLREFQVLQVILIGVCLAAFVCVGIFFRGFLVRHINDEIELRAINQQLDASNQQLRAGEQQLRAANQQLTANEQQLRAANQQLAANEQQLQEYAKMLESKNKELQSIVWVASHDLKSPLVNITGFSQILMESCEKLGELIAALKPKGKDGKEILSLLHEDIPESLKYIDSSTIKINMLINGLLEISRLGSAQMNTERLDMNNLIQQVIKSNAFRAKDVGVSITFDELPECIGDGSRVNQVFSNLIDNALKYLDPVRKGSIHISG